MWKLLVNKKSTWRKFFLKFDVNMWKRKREVVKAEMKENVLFRKGRIIKPKEMTWGEYKKIYDFHIGAWITVNMN